MRWRRVPMAAISMSCGGLGALGGEPDRMTPAWSQFFGEADVRSLAQLRDLSATLARQIHDNGVTYNVYADADGPQRPGRWTCSR